MGKPAWVAGLALALLVGCGERGVLLTGERLNLRDERATVDVARPITLPAPVVRADWTHKAAAPDHDIPHAAFATAPRLLFSRDIGHGTTRRSRITADPVVSAGRIFTVDSRARVMAHSTSGEPLWSTSLVPPGEPVGDASGAGLAVSGQTLYVGTAYGDLHALDVTTGQPRWRQDLGAPAAGAPTVAGDLVYIVGRDATAWAIETGTGRVAWTEQGTPDATGLVGGAAPAVSGDIVVLPFASRELRGLLREGGTRRWTRTVAGTRLGAVYAAITDISGDPVIENGRIYAGSPSGRTDAFDLQSGVPIWSAEEGAMSPVLVAGGAVFAVTDQAEVVRLDESTGDRVWGTKLPYYQPSRLSRRAAVYSHYGPILAGGRLWVASSDGLLRALSPENGAILSEIALPDGATTAPVVAGRTLYVVNQDGRLLAFR